jgi:basic membrane protein A
MRAAPFALAALLVTALTLAGSDGATAKPQLRIGYVVAAGTEPSDHNLFGLPLLGFVQAVKKFDVHGRVVYVSPNQDPTAALESLARQRYDLIIMGFPGIQSVDAVARKFPRVKFLLPDNSLAELRQAARANVQGTLFRAEEAGYLAGYLAALMDDRRPGKHVISSVGGFKFSGVDRWIVGYNAGAQKADPRVVNLTGYSQDFANSAKCRTVALSQIARGSGVVFNVAGACGLGALQAAKEENVWGVGVDVDQSYLGRHILTSAVINWDKPVVDAIRRLVQGTFTTGADTIYSLRNGGVGLGKISPLVPRSFVRRLNEIRRQIGAGAIKVPRAT